jgi:uncharacterized protein (TIGR03437 family)
MNRRQLTLLGMRTFAAVSLCGGAWTQSGTPETILEIETDKVVNYGNDVPDYSKLATDPNMTNGAAARNFNVLLMLGDIVAVNGRPAKGTWIQRGQGVNSATAPRPGQAVADIGRLRVAEMIFEIQQTDGTPIGTIFAIGLGGGAPPPGAPSAATASNFAVIGGTGAFLGVRGQLGSPPAPVAARQASVTEDPANRRVHGGGNGRHVLHLIHPQRPEIMTLASGPAVAHSSDFSPVTVARPARSGETLSLIATSLGPTRPGVDPGQPFPASPLQPTSSPIEITVNGAPVEVLYAGGYPGAVDVYQVNFRMPAVTGAGQARIRVTAAWISGSEVSIAVQ